MQKDSETPEKTHFGFESVSAAEKTKRVADVFHSVSNQYDLMNDVMSFGIHRLWKRAAIDLLSVHRGHIVLDCAAGTGDLSIKIASLVGANGKVIVSDINKSMLAIGRNKLIDRGFVNNIQIVQADAEQLPFENNTIDRVIMGFGLRNVTRKERALESIFRVLKPGGRVVILEFSKPILPGLKPFYDAYSFHILPWLGKHIAQDAESYRYLAESIRMHPDQYTLKSMMEQAGFENCDYHNLSGGIVALHRGYKF